MTSIEWTDETWNPVRGCTRVSEGCRNCYAEIMAARFSDPGQWGEGLADRVTLPNGAKDHRWTGVVEMAPQHVLEKPFSWRKPRMVFVNSTSDLFHESLSFEDIDKVFAVMALTPRHTYQVLTKRPDRMREYTKRRTARARHPAMGYAALMSMTGRWNTPALNLLEWPLQHVWMGVSVEDQATADARIPHLLGASAAIRFISAEPLLGPVCLDELQRRADIPGDEYSALHCDVDVADDDWGGATLDWVIVGGESGPGARPMHPDWARSLRDQCQAAGVPFFFKQWGAWLPWEWGTSPNLEAQNGDWRDANTLPDLNDTDVMKRWDDRHIYEAESVLYEAVGKKRSGRLLDGCTHDAMPVGGGAFNGPPVYGPGVGNTRVLP